jgi:GNAT superfamily N-acetyltransferase
VRRPSWTIRPKGERDAEAVVAILAEVAREGRFIATEWPFDVSARTRALRDALLTRRAVGWVAVEGSEIVGDLTLFELERDEPVLGMVVAEHHRGRGIGRALLEHAIAWARANAKPAITLRVFPDNDRALRLYRAGGFVGVELQPAAIVRRDGTALATLLMRRAIEER